MKYYFGKSIWKWILLYVVIAAVAYGLVYYFVFYGKENYGENYQYNSEFKFTDETADWKIHRNDQKGYEIRYPDDWKKSISVNIYDRTNCVIPFYEFVKNGGVVDPPDFPYTKVTLESISKIITQNNLEGWKTSWIYSNPTNDKKFYLTLANFENNKTCLIAEIPLSKNTEINQNNPIPAMYDKILSTFKFTK